MCAFSDSPRVTRRASSFRINDFRSHNFRNHNFRNNAISLVVSILLLAGCQQHSEPLPPPIPSVKTFVVSDQSKGQARRLAGNLTAADESILSFAVSGTVAKVKATRGDKVQEGAILAVLNSRPFELALENARAQLAANRARLKESEQRYERIKKLVDSKYISNADYDLAEAEYRSARANLASAQTQLEDAERNLKHTVMVAPFTGTVSARDIEPFEEVKSGDQAFVLSSQARVQVEVLVPETMIRNVEFGQKVSIDFPALPGVLGEGVVAEIGSQVGAGSAYPVKVELLGQHDELRLGMSAAVTFNFSSRPDGRPAYLLPITALKFEGLTMDGGAPAEPWASVFVVTANSNEETTSTLTLQSRKVLIGSLRGNQLEIFEGLSEGDRVVSAGVPLLREDMKVRLWQAEQGLTQ